MGDADHVCELCESGLAEQVRAAEAEVERLQKVCEAYYLPLAVACLRVCDYDGAAKVLARCPDHVTKCFILDAVRCCKRGEGQFAPAKRTSHRAELEYSAVSAEGAKPTAHHPSRDPGAQRT